MSSYLCNSFNGASGKGPSDSSRNARPGVSNESSGRSWVMNSPNPGFKLGPFVLEPNGPMLIVSHPLGLKGRNIRMIISSWDRDIGLVCHDWWNVALPKVICQGKAHLYQVTVVFCSLQYTKITTVKTFRRAQSHCWAVHPTNLSQKQEKNIWMDIKIIYQKKYSS